MHPMAAGEDNYGLSDDEENDDCLADDDIDDSEVCNIPELSMEQLLIGGTFAGASTFRSFLGRHRLEPLPEEEDSLSVSSSGGGGGGGTGGTDTLVGTTGSVGKQQQQQQRQAGWW